MRVDGLCHQKSTREHASADTIRSVKVTGASVETQQTHCQIISSVLHRWEYTSGEEYQRSAAIG